MKEIKELRSQGPRKIICVYCNFKELFGSHVGKSYIKPSLKIFREVEEVSQVVLDDFHKKR